MKKFTSSISVILPLVFLVGGFSLLISVANAQIATNATTYFAPLDANINVGESVQLKYILEKQESNGQWYSLTADTLESFGGGLFRGLSEGYGKARIVTPNSGPAETVVGIVDPNKVSNSQYDVTLVNRHPIYTWADAKFNHEHGVSPFKNIDFISTGGSAGHFAVVGECSDGLDARIGGLSSHDVELEGGGLYVFSETGQFIEKENVCRDTMRPTTCYEGGGCVIGKDISPVGNGKFILDTGGEEYGRTPYRSPLLYGIQGTSVSRENRLFFTDDPTDLPDRRDLIRFQYIAYANGVMVGVGTETTGQPPRRISGFPGSSSREEKNIFYSVPEFQRLADASVPLTCPSRSCSGGPALTQELYIPVFGIGEYFVAAEGTSGGIITTQPPYSVYRMPSRQELRDGELPAKVQTLNDVAHEVFRTSVAGIVRDAQNPNRVMIHGTNVRGGAPYVIYEPTSDGLEVVEKGTINNGGTSLGHNVALSGDYIAYTSCRSYSGDVFNFQSAQTCELSVLKNGQLLSVEPLPLNIFGGDNMPAVAISPSGYVMVAAYNWTGIAGENGNLYLYRIGGATTPTNPNLPQIPDFSNINPTQPTFDINDFLNSTQNYINSLQNYFSTPNTTNTQTNLSTSSGQTTQYTLNRPPETIAEIRQFQCAYNIVCTGSIATTGYGNLGPQTRAKIQEVFEQGSVNGAHTTQTREELQMRINALTQQVQDLLLRFEEAKE